MEFCGASFKSSAYDATSSSDDEDVLSNSSIEEDPISKSKERVEPSTPDQVAPPTVSLVHGATPSPLYLNPMSEEDWSTRKKMSSHLKLSLAVDHTRQLMTGVDIHLCRGGERKPITLRFDGGKAVLTISFGQNQDEKKVDDEDEAPPIFLPISSISSLTDSQGTTFIAKMRPNMSAIKQLEFDCSSTSNKDKIFDAVRSLISANRPLQLQRRNRSLLSTVGARFSPANNKKGEGTSPQSTEAESSTKSSSRRIRVHEAGNNKTGANIQAEQGMELTLMETSSSGGGSISMPVLSSDGSDIRLGVIPENYQTRFQTFNVSPPDGELPINPWCAQDVCTLHDVAEAFGELFGIQETSKDDKEESWQGASLNNSAEEVPVINPTFSTSIARKPSTTTLCNNEHIRNRADNINQQARHWQELKNSMTFAAVREGRRIPHLQTTHSTDECCHRRRLGPQPIRSKRNNAKKNNNNDDGGGGADTQEVFFLMRAMDDIVQHLISPSETKALEDDVLYYDSDPEHTRERTFQSASRQAPAKYWNRIEHPVPFQTLELPKAILRSKCLTDDDIKTVVEMMKSCKLHLLWHTSNTARPLCIKAWIERGTYLMNQNFLQPKFMWKAAYEADLASSRKINSTLFKFDLLEIARIDRTPSTTHMLAHSLCCFGIKTKNNYHIFEASSPHESVQIVFGLKLVVARLASLLIVRDASAVDEFFEPMEAVVPGQAPKWIS